ncbi:MAG: carbamoyltransferase C-terminal domain-containing protein [Bacteroidota bacterium]|nr:carbamoyltransferase C-terminal domain-containing protein [Bacteroidota bacterium]
MAGIVLGLNAYHADSSAAIFVNGELLAATEEERFRRVKHWAGFPTEAIKFCLKEANCTLADVTAITIGRDPSAKWDRKARFVIQHPRAAWSMWSQRSVNKDDIEKLHERFEEVEPSVDVEMVKAKIQFIEHHRSHLASAFFSSPFEEAAVLSIDGSGDFTTTMMARGKGTDIEVLDSLDFPASVGLFYTAFTQYLGFPHYGDEYKVMGLAPYGTPRFLEQVATFLPIEEGGWYRFPMKDYRLDGGVVSYPNNLPTVAPLFGARFEEVFGPTRKKGEPLTQEHMDLAASVQRHCEEVIFHLLRRLHEETGLDRVCIAGGVAQNSVANGKMTRNTPFKEVYIPSAGHDAGISMGSAQYHIHCSLSQPRVPSLKYAHTGCRFSNEEVEAFLKSEGVEYIRYESDAELYDVVSDALVDGKVIGWFNGRAEFGPRALGGRSIIVDPRRADAKDLLNSKIKRRESFRPFAPSILSEHVKDWFELDEPVPFMEKVFPIRPERHDEIPAVTHVDGSGRLQSVYADATPRYHALISAFHAKSGVPILLNTSFNENEPIVNAPEHAYACYARTSMDMLVMENCVVRRD